jgi:hypothetical protein
VNGGQRRLLGGLAVPGVGCLLYAMWVRQLGGPLADEWSAVALVGVALLLVGAGAVEVVALVGE